jgi:predicted secreted hydrolase
MELTNTALRVLTVALLAAVFMLEDVGAEPLNQEGWALAVPGYQITLPADNGPHYRYRTEWWYFTGNLKSREGRDFGYQLTFFRYGFRPPERRESVTSRFVLNDLKFAHFTVTDVKANRFHSESRTSRGAYGEAGFGSGRKLAWIENWECDFQKNFHLTASGKDYSIDLELNADRPAVLQGENGLSQKSDGIGNASYYYSITRMPTTGSITIGSEQFEVAGSSWYDREWASNQLAANQLGWNWFAIQLSDGADLMLYQLRLKGGKIDPHSCGVLVRTDGTKVNISADEIQMKPIEFWQNPDTQSKYPVAWNLEIPALMLHLGISTPVKDQELKLGVVYWEGCIRLLGAREGQPVNGVGYMELTGYQGKVPGL